MVQELKQPIQIVMINTKGPWCIEKRDKVMSVDILRLLYIIFNCLHL